VNLSLQVEKILITRVFWIARKFHQVEVSIKMIIVRGRRGLILEVTAKTQTKIKAQYLSWTYFNLSKLNLKRKRRKRRIWVTFCTKKDHSMFKTIWNTFKMTMTNLSRVEHWQDYKSSTKKITRTQTTLHLQLFLKLTHIQIVSLINPILTGNLLEALISSLIIREKKILMTFQIYLEVKP